jgi:iron(III) transport system ATP-binding protein
VILDLEGVTKQFPRCPNPAVSAVSLRLSQGDILALLGPSGCGKTTLLRLVAGFEVPDAGTVAIAQQTVAGSGRWVAPERRGVGMVFQDYALFPHLTVAQNVAFGLSQRDRQTKVAKAQVQNVLDLVGLRGLENRYPHELSGGQQQRVALARALAPSPFLVLLDEPLSNLDVQVRLKLRQELREILKAAGTTAVFVTHDQEEALSIADQVGVMRAGHLEQIDPPERVYQFPQSRFVAEFVTQANFIAAERQDDGWMSEVGLLSNVQVTDRLAADRVIEVMIRQEEFQLVPDGQSSLIISDRQFLGREQRYSIRTPAGHVLVARTSAAVNLPVGTPVGMRVNSPVLQGFAASSPLTLQAC